MIMSPEIELVPAEEQVVRKKAEEKPLEPTKPIISKPIVSKPIVPKIRKKPTIPVFVPEKERMAGVPVIPGDPCCAKVCKALNDTVDRNARILDTVVSMGGTQENKTYRYMLYGRESLEDHRQNLKDKEACRCIEETGAVSIMVPLIRAIEVTEDKQLVISRGAIGTLRARPPEAIRTVHRGERPIVPTENSCCSNTCKLLNNEIDTNNKILDQMELRGGPAVYKNPRYEALSYKTFHLQEHRGELKRKDSCKCFE